MPRVPGELRLAILGMDKSVNALRYELSGSVWDDVARRWTDVRGHVTAVEDYEKLVVHHRECERAGERMAEVLRALLLVGEMEGDIDLSAWLAARQALDGWNAHQWPKDEARD